MDIRTALSGMVPFQLSETQLWAIATSRGLDIGGDFTPGMSKSMAFELSMADMIRVIIMTPNVSEGGVSISYGDKRALMGIANRIYAKYGEPLLGESNPTVRYREDF